MLAVPFRLLVCNNDLELVVQAYRSVQRVMQSEFMMQHGEHKTRLMNTGQGRAGCHIEMRKHERVLACVKNRL